MAEKNKSKPKLKVVKKTADYTPVFKKRYFDEVIPSMTARFEYSNVMEVPKISKISINMGIGDAKINSKALESAEKELAMISGQKSVITKSKKDISNFKIRRGFPVGCKVTLRGSRMFEFFERLVSIALPRTRDFRGLSFKSFDGQGNYSFGIKEQIIFTEIDYDKIDSIRGMDISITTTAGTDDEAYWLLKDFGFPLRVKPVKSNPIETINGEA
ncbi:MAG: 50S ribosomal protein L5 [Candidatus Marinimicrobia bacterium]|jgi:large subunit ribosomal protein L5|nr:50S ribosomal protein L5 [Candidatus Neomarinimicrobiota bacterium]MBT3617222.1 50S ribosomal protein L5 [Candidatus Neomarinimicrobiota bacterium]MBT3829741.1 50S ribosomal protein L5 [Candidatus Neomarinimicrobiota bacterium]MBT3997912.1 50S ribosomal protein L5 [Candidatus Neomarinimicrobiota bacterium]MBT4281290.1 50S ribosomal protein L5 [Candidatus Neomarinimicrobiota bacterium]